MTLKLIKGGSPDDPTDSRTHTARRRTGSRRTVTQRTPSPRDPVAEVLERLDQEPATEPTGEPGEEPTTALAAAEQACVDFVSVSAASVDRDLQRILAGTTGDFRDEFSRGQAQVRAAVVGNNVRSQGTVLRAALLSGDRRRATVLVAIDATVRNTNAPEGRRSHYRIQVELVRADGRWLVSRLQFVR